MLRRAALVRTDVSEELSASIIRVTRIGELRSVRRLLVRANVVPSSSILVTLMMEELSSSGTSVLTRATRLLYARDQGRTGSLYTHFQGNGGITI
jgi:hypothetical protein